MANAENAKIQYEGGQNQSPMGALILETQQLLSQGPRSGHVAQDMRPLFGQMAL